MAVCSPFVGSSSPTAGRESLLMVLPVSALNRFWHATGKWVGASSVHTLYQRNVWTGGEQTICHCWWLHIMEVVRKPAERPAVPYWKLRQARRRDLWEATLQCFQSCSLDLGIIRKSWQVFNDVISEIFLELCLAGLGELLSSVMHSCWFTL